MRNDYANQSGLCLIKENLSQMTDAQKSNMYSELRPNGCAKGYDPTGQVKPDAILKMSEALFNDISEGKASPIVATFTGRLKFEGKLSVIKRFDEIVINKYCDDVAAAYKAAQ